MLRKMLELIPSAQSAEIIRSIANGTVRGLPASWMLDFPLPMADERPPQSPPLPAEQLSGCGCDPCTIGRQQQRSFEVVCVSCVPLGGPLPSPPRSSPSAAPAGAVDSSEDEHVPCSPGVTKPRAKTSKRGKGISPDLLAAEMPAPKHSAAAASDAPDGDEEPEPRRPRRLASRWGNVEKVRVDAEAAKAAEVKAALERKLAPYGGRCWWCWQEGNPHDPDARDCCSAKQIPVMSSAPAVTRLAARGYTKPHGRKQTSLTEDQYKRWHCAREAERKRLKREFKAAAQKRLLAWMAEMECVRAEAATAAATPLPGSGPLGQYTFYEKVAFEFAMRLDTWMSSEQLARPPGTVDHAARQLFAKLVKQAGLPSLAAARTRGDTTITGFVALRARLHAVPLIEQYQSLINAVHAEELIKYGSLAEVKALSPSATLLDILGAVRQAAEPKMGRRPNAPAADATDTSSAGGHGVTAANNWVDGGYSTEAMDAQASYGARAINVSLKRSQADILEATNLMTKGFPESLTEFRACRPSKRPGAVACCSTAALHAAQLNEYEVEEAAAHVEIWFPCFDAGSKRRVSAMLGGGTGILANVDCADPESWDDVYQDALGIEILSQKTGAAGAASIQRINDRRGVKEYYFVSSDAANDMTGHLTGAIAFLRRQRDCVAILVNRCLAHITARSMKHMLLAEKSTLPVLAPRVSITRKQARAKGRRDAAAARRAQAAEAADADQEMDDAAPPGEQSADDAAALPPQLMLLEDCCYVEMKWPELREAIQASQKEHYKKQSGTVDSRWTVNQELMQQKIGVTQILTRLVDLWEAGIVERDVQAGTLRELATSMWDEAALEDVINEDIPRVAIAIAIANDAWLKNDFDFDVVTELDDTEVTWDNLLDAYTGSWILPALDVISKMLNPDGVSVADLRKPGASLAPPATCPVSAITEDTLPPLLVDLAMPTMRMRLVIDEVISTTYIVPHLHAVEVRRPGIFYSVHHLLGMHQDIAEIFGNPDCPWDIGNLGVLNLEFSLGLQAAMMYAEGHDLSDAARTYIDESMAAYGKYHKEQTAEWWENPAFRLGATGSSETDSKCEDHGIWHARYLVEEGQAELIHSLARHCHCTVGALKACLRGAAYRGPMKLLVDDELWEQLVDFSKQEETLWVCEGVDELRNLVYRHYKGLFISNVWCEELVKEFKNLSHQARAHPESAEIRILLHQRRIRKRRYFALPTRARIKQIRRKLGHHLRRRARAKRLPPAEPLPPVTWAGHDGTAEKDEDEDEEDEEDEEEDPSTLTVKELKVKLKALGVSGYSELKKAALVELLQKELGVVEEEATHDAELDAGEDDDGEPEDDDTEAEMTETEKAVLKQLRTAPVVERGELQSSGRAFFCWDDDRKLNYFPVVLKKGVQPRAKTVNVICLQPKVPGIYVVDPNFNGDTGKRKKDYARNDLLFDAQPITGEVWRPIEGGFEGESAWRVVKR